MMKRVLRVVSAALVFALTLGMTACSSGTGSASSTGSAASGQVSTNLASAGVTQVKFWHYMSMDKEGAQVQKIVDKYNASQSRVKVIAQYIPRDELMKQYTIGAVSSDLPDVGCVDNPDNVSYASMGVFDDITDLFKAWDEAKFLDGPLSSCKFEGKLYGIPWGSNCLGLFYDEDVLKEANVSVPTTWSELTAVCKKLTHGT